VADYDKQNIADLANSAADFGLAPDLEARFGRKALAMERGGFSYQRMAPGLRSAFGHRHSDQEEIYIVLEGSGRARVGDEEVPLNRRDVLRVSPEAWRAFEAGDDGLELLVFGSGDAGDSELDAGFWPSGHA
jgi:uncharacterized cupin superfamily protein